MNLLCFSVPFQLKSECFAFIVMRALVVWYEGLISIVALIIFFYLSFHGHIGSVSSPSNYLRLISELAMYFDESQVPKWQFPL